MNTMMALTQETLRRETRAWRGSGGVSEESRGSGYVPAFKDIATGKTYLARYANGSVAPMHLLDGLPKEVVLRHDETGRPTAAKSSLVAGFVRGGRFYTREQTAAQIACAYEPCACACD